MAGALFLLFFAGGIYPAHGQSSPVRILFIGNSFTEGNDLPDIESGLAETAGIKTEIKAYIALGKSVDYFIHDPACWNFIRSRPWDYIVIQDDQQYYSGSVGKIDSFGYPSPLLINNIIFQDSIKKLIPCVKIIYFAGWGKNGGDTSMFPNDNTVKLVRRIADNYLYMNNLPMVHNVIAPIGIAWISCINQRPHLASNVDTFLYSPDGRHPGKAGSYLAACVIFVTVFHRSPVGFKDSYRFVSQNLKTFLQQNAWDAVTGSIKYSNLGGIAPVVRNRGRTMYASKKYTSYQWYNNNSPIKGANLYLYKCPLTGKAQEYRVEAIDKKGCIYRSFPLRIN